MPGGVWDEMSLWLGLGGAPKKAYEPSLYLADHLVGVNPGLTCGRLRFHRGSATWTSCTSTVVARSERRPGRRHLPLQRRTPWDNPLVTSRVHNTVTADGRDQMTRGGRFMTLGLVPAYSKSVVPTDESVLGQVVAITRAIVVCAMNGP